MKTVRTPFPGIVGINSLLFYFVVLQYVGSLSVCLSVSQSLWLLFKDDKPIRVIPWNMSRGFAVKRALNDVDGRCELGKHSVH